jgi:hypothetical protein
MKYAVIQYKNGRKVKIKFDTKKDAEAFKADCLKKYPNIDIEIKEVD